MSYCNRSYKPEPIEPKGHTESGLSKLAYTRNMHSLLSSFTPTVPIKFLIERLTLDSQNSECMEIPYFSLEDLWESLIEGSAFGVAVPLILNENERDPITKQYYVPSLSAIQLYVDPQTLGRLGEDKTSESDNSQKFSRLSLNKSEVVNNSRDQLVYQYFEKDKPHCRPPLRDTVSILAHDFPNLNNYKSCDLSPSSWLSVAWYPIYRIPQGPTLKNLDTSFLTFHSLSTNSTTKNQLLASKGDERPSKISLPSFALATYKMEGTIFNPVGDSETEEMKSLFRTAGDWLRSLEVYHHDYGFFASNFRIK